MLDIGHQLTSLLQQTSLFVKMQRIPHSGWRSIPAKITIFSRQNYSYSIDANNERKTVETANKKHSRLI